MVDLRDSWAYCAVEGCLKYPRLSGLCSEHDNEALMALMDAPPYYNVFPQGFDKWLEERLKDPAFKKAYDKEYAKILLDLQKARGYT